ncbi:hypothetical protein, partial [Deinococcus sp. 43]|uniref:hypothetical protein n=1 Tax=Deinococcus sp. 43 TaxID=532020 RepID=UPI0024DE6E3D
ADRAPQMWTSDRPLGKQEEPMLYPALEPSLYSKLSKLWGQPTTCHGSTIKPSVEAIESGLVEFKDFVA